jgi:hypothetical protein
MKRLEDTVNQAAWWALCQRDKAIAAARRTLAGGQVDMRSRRGIEGAVWNVLTLLAIGGIAIAMLFVLGPVIIARAQQATQRLTAAPGW